MEMEIKSTRGCIDFSPVLYRLTEWLYDTSSQEHSTPEPSTRDDNIASETADILARESQIPDASALSASALSVHQIDFSPLLYRLTAWLCGTSSQEHSTPEPSTSNHNIASEIADVLARESQIPDAPAISVNQEDAIAAAKARMDAELAAILTQFDLEHAAESQAEDRAKEEIKQEGHPDPECMVTLKTCSQTRQFQGRVAFNHTAMLLSADGSFEYAPAQMKSLEEKYGGMIVQSTDMRFEPFERVRSIKDLTAWYTHRIKGLDLGDDFDGLQGEAVENAVMNMAERPCS